MEHKLIISNGEESIDFYNDKYILISSVEGVGVDCNVNVTEYGSRSGGMLGGTHVPSRTITIAAKFKALGDMSAQKMRLYSIFKAGQPLDIRYVTPSADVVTVGYCSKLDIPPNNYPLVISAEIVCPDPYFKQRYVEPIQLFGSSSLFYFLSGGITLNDVCFGNTGRARIVHLDYSGDIEAGVVIKVALLAACSNFRVDNYTAGKYISLTGNFLSGDVIEISTEDGRKYIKLTRGKKTVSGLKYMDAGSEFWQLGTGNNDIKFTASGLDASAALVMMYYDIKVGGV